MIIQKFDNEQDWLEAREGKITGTKLKDVLTKRGDGRKIGFYQLIADRLAIQDDENPMERGHRLEPEAIDMLSVTTGIKFNKDLVIISRDENPNIAWSPDGYKEDLTVAAEVKCLRSALHIQAIIEDKIPYDYIDQSIQPFIVCDTLQKLLFVFYDPRIAARPFHVIEVNRKDIEDKIKSYKDYEEQTLKEVDQWVEKLSW